MRYCGCIREWDVSVIWIARVFIAGNVRCFDRGMFVFKAAGGEKPVDSPGMLARFWGWDRRTLIMVASEPLSKLLTLYPRTYDIVGQQLSQAFQKISDHEFRVAKDRICLFRELISLSKVKLDEQAWVPILEAVLEGNVEQAKAKAKASSGTGGGSGKQHNTRSSLIPATWRTRFRGALKLWSPGDNEIEGAMDDLLQQATDAAREITDSQFMIQLGHDAEQFAQYNALLTPLADKARARAFAHLEINITQMTKKLTPLVHRVQGEECSGWIRREQASRAEEEQHNLRVKLIKQLNCLSAHTAPKQVIPTMLLSNKS